MVESLRLKVRLMTQFFQLTIIATALVCSGCSTFNYEWRQAAKEPAPTNDITGRWEGRWVSKSSGHTERLRALIAQADKNHYDVKFHAAYKFETLKFITAHFGYTVRMETVPDTNDLIAFRGSEDLGKLAGGVYTYEGHADAMNFFSTYKSKYDRGVFEMKRPAEK
jgi:hypothetical protein